MGKTAPDAIPAPELSGDVNESIGETHKEISMSDHEKTAMLNSHHNGYDRHSISFGES